MFLQPLYNVNAAADGKVSAVVAAARARVATLDPLRFPGVDELTAGLAATVAAPPGGSALVSAAAKVTAELLSNHASLRLLRHIPVLATFYRWLHTAFAHRVSSGVSSLKLPCFCVAMQAAASSRCLYVLVRLAG